MSTLLSSQAVSSFLGFPTEKVQLLCCCQRFLLNILKERLKDASSNFFFLGGFAYCGWFSISLDVFVYRLAELENQLRRVRLRRLGIECMESVEFA